MVLLNVRSDPFFIYKICMRFCGIWPPDAFKSKSRTIYLVSAFLEVVLILSPLISLFAKCFVRGTKKELIPSGALIFLSTLRLTARVYGSRSNPVIESTVDDWSSITDPTERKIMKRHDKFGTYTILILSIWFVVYPCVRDVILVAFPNTPTTLDDEQNCAGNESVTFGIVLAFLIIAMKGYNTLSYCSNFLLFWSLAMHLCGQFQILKLQFEKFLLITEKKERRKVFRRLVQRHNHLLELSDKLENTFNLVLGLFIFGAQFLICLKANKLGHAIKNADFMKMVMSFIFITFYTVTIFLYYYINDYLTTCAKMIGDVFTECNWYDLSKESIIHFSIVIARSHRTPKFTAAKIYKLSLSNFKHVLDVIYSYVSLIVAITDD